MSEDSLHENWTSQRERETGWRKMAVRLAFLEEQKRGSDSAFICNCAEQSPFPVTVTRKAAPCSGWMALQHGDRELLCICPWNFPAVTPGLDGACSPHISPGRRPGRERGNPAPDTECARLKQEGTTPRAVGHSVAVLGGFCSVR